TRSTVRMLRKPLRLKSPTGSRTPKSSANLIRRAEFDEGRDMFAAFLVEERCETRRFGYQRSDQRDCAASSSAFTSTQPCGLPSASCSCFQNGARVFRKSIMKDAASKAA